MTTTSAPAARPSCVAPWASGPARSRLVELESRLAAIGGVDVAAAVSDALHGHHQRVQRGVMLSAATNVMSPAVAALHDAALSTRPSMGWPGAKEQTAVQDVEHLEVLAISQVARAMRAAFAEVRFPSATIANLGVYVAFTRPGDTIAVLSPEAGGHQSHQGELGAAAIRGLHVAHLPYSPRNLDVDPDDLYAFVDAVQPRLIVVGGSVQLFPNDLGPVRAAADRVGAVVLYDASHTAGLIAAGHFQQPLDEGADVMTFSTYKTFAGPAGGVAVTNSVEFARLISSAAYPTLSSNYDPARLGPLAMAAAEAAEQRPAWAGPTIDCAVGLATELHHRGYAVVGSDRGFTRSHQVVIDVGTKGDASSSVHRLEEAGIYAGGCRVPGQPRESLSRGIRFGLQEFVRRGGTVSAAPKLASVIDCVLRGGAREESRSETEALLEHLTVDLWGRRVAPPSTSLRGAP